MRVDSNFLHDYVERYLTKSEYQQFLRYLDERNSPNIIVRMHANMEISRIVKKIRKKASRQRHVQKI